MIRYISLRLLFALPALWLIVTMVFLLAHIVPGDPVAQMLGEGARADDLQQLRHTLGLDVPIPVQYERYLKGVLHGNLGESFRFQQPVTKVILEHYPATLELAAVALGVCLLIGIPAGVLAAHKRGEKTDHAVGVLTLFGLSLPNFALGPVLMLVFSVILGWLPVSGRGGASHSGSSRVHVRRGACRDPHAHGAHVGDRGAFSRLCAHGACEGRFGVGSAVSPRAAQCADSDSHDSRPAIRHAARGNDRHRNDFFLAGNRAPRSASDRRRAIIRCCRVAFC